MYTQHNPQKHLKVDKLSHPLNHICPHHPYFAWVSAFVFMPALLVSSNSSSCIQTSIRGA